ncbi:MAG: PolC-type DNA polymerase III [Lachnospiraceae bacterium]|nr:PolC-type DNA polymerase III [Lachnospiraceae bacterium]
MAMKFFEVFDGIHLEERLSALMEDTTVEKLTTDSQRTLLRVYLSSPRLIDRQDICKVQEAIRKQKMAASGMEVKIYERFQLPNHFTAEKVYSSYEDSIVFSIKEIGHVDYKIFHDADVVFEEGGVMKLTLEDTMIAHEKEKELIEALNSILNVRCGLNVSIYVDYKEAQKSRFKEENEHKVNLMVQEITRRAGGNRNEGSDGSEFADYGEEKKEEKKEAKPAENQKKVEKANTTKNADKDNKGEGEKKEKKRMPLKRSDAPDVIYGRDFDDDTIPIKDIVDEIGEVTIRGKITEAEGRELRNDKYIYTFAVTDFTDTISSKIFCWADQAEEFVPALKPGEFVKIKGIAKFDEYVGELMVSSIAGIKKIKDFTTIRMDTAFKKRVELHCHTKMSDSDGVSYAKDLIKRARKWDMPAIAITDHGCVQAFPEAKHTTDKLEGIKVLYGVEAYIVDDLTDTVVNDMGQSLRDDFVVFDIETTGFSPIKNKIIEIGAVKVSDGKICDRFSCFVNPHTPIPFEIERLTGINDDMVADAEDIETVLPKFLEFCKGCVLVAHNASFDMSFIKENMKRQKIVQELTYVDTVAISRALLTDMAKHTLDSISKKLNISLENHHRAVDDAEATAQIFEKFILMLEEKDIHTLSQVNEFTDASVETIRKMPSYHAIILAKTEEGRRNLYRMVSESHVKYFNRQPKLPKSFVMKHREGIILGTACEAGELYRALLDEKSPEDIARIINFYDYLEIQPLDNNKFMLKSDKFRNINSYDDLIAINKRIVALGEEYNKPVCATCDVHFMDPEDEIYRRIIMAGKGFSDADDQAPLYLRTTEEMLKEFEYLGSEKAEEVVITNTNLIADMCEVVSPIDPNKCAPVIENSDETLRKICYTRAHELYGENLPEVVEKRLERELNSIISNGFAVMYIIAQKLVWKSNEDGYLVGSRGSVGSSFVATMAGITEVNPLSPHYYCSECHYSDFESDDVKAYAGRAGCDMPDKNCPVCGAKLNKDGFDIPFETFLGFYGDKEPDIDLNFSGEYQSKAHKYTEVIFGAGQTYRAGTIGTLAEKTAFGYVKKYYEERGIKKRTAEINRIVQGCVDVRRTTGQHPGGIIVLPIGHDINEFTPIQRPANDMTTDIITTHFDYHSIDHNLLKLDILGHDDPTMIRMLQDLTGIDPLTIPLDDPQVMSLFQSTEALGITPDQIGGCKLGSLGIPEFGTDFAMQMLIDTHPTSFSDLVRIAGLSHGTDVWLGNAQTLIMDGVATISTAICTRDDIMVYLIGKGVDAGMSFKIMESVRKGKGLTPEWEEQMVAHDVPDWYIWSCKKIKYMFPKAHAAAYVMMAWRIAYCKVNYPLAYYSAYFSIRAVDGFDYAIMCQGQKHLEQVMEDYRSRENELSKKEEEVMKVMRIVQEMYARGFEFWPLDIFRAHPRNFQIIDGKIMPALVSVEGLAEKAAEGIVEAVKGGPFISRDDFRERSKVSKTVVEAMANLGLLGDLPESNQMSLFDFV